MRRLSVSGKTGKSLRNLAVAVPAHFVQLAFSFIDRTVFVWVLSAEYLGLNGLFSGVLSMLSLAELGMGGAIAYALYAPLGAGDTALIQSIMALYRRLYRVVGVSILVLGLACVPFLPQLVKEMPRDMPLIELYFLLYVANVGISYFFSYKRTLIICDQRQYLSTAVSTASSVVASLLHMVVLLLTGSYLLYLVAGIAVSLGENIVISHMADRRYPYLRERDARPLPREVLGDIRRNVYAMLCHRIGAVVVYSTDELVISRFVGLASVGLYSNYVLLLSKAAGLLRLFFSSVLASVGALSLEEDKRHVERVLYRMLFLSFLMYAFCAVALVCLAGPLIALWLGRDYLLPEVTVAAIAVNFYLTGMRQTVLTFRDAAGVFWHDRYKALVEAALNLALSIPLAMRFGVCGVLLGAIASTLLVPFWFDAHILFKHLLGKGIAEYLRRQACYALVALAAGASAWALCGFVPGMGLASLLVRAVLCTAAFLGVVAVCCARMEEAAYCRGMLREVLRRRG